MRMAFKSTVEKFPTFLALARENPRRVPSIRQAFDLHQTQTHAHGDCTNTGFVEGVETNVVFISLIFRKDSAR